MSVRFSFPDGGALIVDEENVGSTIEFFRKSNARKKEFHELLMSMGVRAYRTNDGWVDREKHIVTLFSDECTYGWYYGVNELKEGDKIFIGDESSGGQFAVVDAVVDSFNLGDHDTRKYHYNLIEEYIDRDWKFRTKAEMTKVFCNSFIDWINIVIGTKLKRRKLLNIFKN